MGVMFVLALALALAGGEAAATDLRLVYLSNVRGEVDPCG